jgi:hypothetical protein
MKIPTEAFLFSVQALVNCFVHFISSIDCFGIIKNLTKLTCHRQHKKGVYKKVVGVQREITNITGQTHEKNQKQKIS